MAFAVCASSLTAQDLSLAARRSDFKTFAEDFSANYAYRDQPRKPWLTWLDRYEPAIDKADTREDFGAALATALSELHDFHAEVRSRVPDRWLPYPTFSDLYAEFQGSDAVVLTVRRGSDSERAGVKTGDRVIAVGPSPAGLLPTAEAVTRRLGSNSGMDEEARNWALLSVLTGRSEESRTLTLKSVSDEPRTITLPVERRFDRPPGQLLSSTLPGNIGLIRFNNSLGDQKTVAAFDQALAQLRSTQGLILDLRDTPSGGESSVALGIMGRFVTSMLPYQRHRIPHYGQGDVERNWIEQVTPRGPFPYNAPVVLMVDHWTGSMGEGMAIGFDGMHRAIIIGTPMAHLAGAVSDFHLPRTGVDVAFATEQLFHVDGTPRERWLPPILVAPDAGNTADPILPRALAEIRQAIR